MTESSGALTARLKEADVLAGSLIARQGSIAPPTDADRAQAQAGGPLSRWTGELGELIEQITVAGLAYPDPDLPAAIQALADRGASLGLRRPIAPAVRLAACLRQCTPTASDAQRQQASAEAFGLLQRLTAWRRLFEREQALMVVDAQLNALGDAQAMPTPSVPTRSLEAWPDGFHYAAGRLTILARDRHDGAPVIIRDSVPDLDAIDPFARPYLSRLFQAAVSLEAVMGSIIVFEDHPVSLRGGASVFAPAFRVAPVLRPVAEHFVPPDLPSAQPGSRRPGLLDVDCVMTPEGPQLMLPDGHPLPVAERPILSLNLRKALTVHPQLGLTVCVIDGPEGARVLHGIHAEARCFLAADPTLFRWTPEALVQAAADGSAWLRAGAALFGGGAAESVQALGEAWPAQPNVPDCWRAAYLRWALGLPLPDADLRDLLALTFHAATRPADCRPADFARVYGVPAGALGAAGRTVSDRVVYMALWLAWLCGDLAAHLPDLRGLYTARYATLDTEPDVHAICARAMLQSIFAEEIAAESDPDDDEARDIYAPIVDYLQTHLSSFVHRPGQARPRPLPSLGGVLALADLWARLTDADPRDAPIARLGFDRTALGASIAQTLYAWRREGAPAAAAGDALWVAAHAGLGRWFVSPVGLQ